MEQMASSIVAKPLRIGEIAIVEKDWLLTFKCDYCQKEIKSFKHFLQHSLAHFFEINANEIELLYEKAFDEPENTQNSIQLQSTIKVEVKDEFIDTDEELEKNEKEILYKKALDEPDNFLPYQNKDLLNEYKGNNKNNSVLETNKVIPTAGIDVIKENIQSNSKDQDKRQELNVIGDDNIKVAKTITNQENENAYLSETDTGFELEFLNCRSNFNCNTTQPKDLKQNYSTRIVNESNNKQTDTGFQLEFLNGTSDTNCNTNKKNTQPKNLKQNYGSRIVNENINKQTDTGFEIEFVSGETNANCNTNNKNTKPKNLKQNYGSRIENENINKETEHLCPHCGKTFLTKYKLSDHIKRHIEKYPCDMCDVVFNDPNNLKVHRFRHLGKKPHNCKICHKSFTTTTEVKLHMRTHTGEKPYVCKVCDASFTTNSSYMKHCRRHTNTCPYNCKDCDKSYFIKRDFDAHIRTHMQEPSYECTICERYFKSAGSLRVHKKLHLPQKQYSCKHCKKEFAQRPGLYKHLKTNHVDVDKCKQATNDSDQHK